jgi:hypothetical protein
VLKQVEAKVKVEDAKGKRLEARGEMVLRSKTKMKM